jgi:hypothetical protein
MSRWDKIHSGRFGLATNLFEPLPYEIRPERVNHITSQYIVPIMAGMFRVFWCTVQTRTSPKLSHCPVGAVGTSELFRRRIIILELFSKGNSSRVPTGSKGLFNLLIYSKFQIHFTCCVETNILDVKNNRSIRIYITDRKCVNHCHWY